MTRKQTQDRQWLALQSGRITASKLKAVTHTDISQPSSSLVQSVCYPEVSKFTSVATTWGCDYEKHAISQYGQFMMTCHQDVVISESGLVIHPQHSYLGASPDARVKCSCCGVGVVEVKCPFNCREMSFDLAADSSKFCLQRNDDGKLSLKRDHAYYYQVQLQLLLCEALYCNFVV